MFLAGLGASRLDNRVVAVLGWLMSNDEKAPLEGEFDPPLEGWVADQLAAIDAAGDTRAADIEGMSVVVYTVRGKRSGKLRRVPLMRVTDGTAYAAVASKGGAPQHPAWYHSMTANPRVDLQDGTQTRPFTVRELSGDERETWWQRCVEAFPPYAEYQADTDRQIPVLLAEPLD